MTLFLFDCVITLSQEVDVIWRPKWTAITWLYAFTRYGAVINRIILLIPDWNIQLRFDYDRGFSALRVYALLDGKYRMAGTVFMLNLVPLATNIYKAATIIVYKDPEVCAASLSGPNSLRLSLSLATRFSVIIGDVLVLAVAWSKTAQAYKEARRLNIKAPLADILFRDGTIYFLSSLIKLYAAGILLVLNVLEIIEDNAPTLFTLSIIEPFFAVIPPMIICRFILNLRQIEPAGNSWVSGSGTPIQSHSLRFVGNMGQSMQIGEVDEDKDCTQDAEGGPRQNASSTQANTLPKIATDAAGSAEADEEHLRYGFDTERHDDSAFCNVEAQHWYMNCSGKTTFYDEAVGTFSRTRISDQGDNLVASWVLYLSQKWVIIQSPLRRRRQWDDR
ncbi:hypothetical protein BC629DRAFT_1442214 [Irpex lacteus]|nr:hypothetical protein BC629DRAFT_1442214 [Irpex lacteus]